MLISPPFLPERAADQTDEQWLAAAMPEPAARGDGTQAPEGSFPLSHNLGWHNGVHVQAPQANGVDLPVRAIADGVVVFVNRPVPVDARADHAQNYNPRGEPVPTWTDNGCVIVRHETSIGFGPAAHPAPRRRAERETELVFYSVYMHLRSLARITPAGERAAREIRADDRIWRKDEIGHAGQVYGHHGQIHFEICLDALNLERLLGRRPQWVEPGAVPVPTADGRIDSLFGSLYVYLPATTAIDAGARMPADHLRPVAPLATLGQAMWVRMSYDRGRCSFESYDLSGTRIGQARTDADGEYALYGQCTARHAALPEAARARSSPSGWYELLRFGRNIGRGPAADQKDLLPEEAAHWRRIVGPDGRELWADLNAVGSFKFSDADFPAVTGWNVVDDDPNPDDQRCDSENIKRLIRDPDPGNATRMEPEQLVRRLGDAGVRQTLRRVFCRFPSEWDRATIATRYGFVRELPGFQADAQAWPRLEAHLRAMTFEDLPQEYLEARWRGHPVEFIANLRRCWWFSNREFVQLMPRNSPAGLVSLADAMPRVVRWGVGLNRMIRKFRFESDLRVVHLLGQVWAETGYLRLMREAGADGQPYAPYVGRGFIQITWRDKYQNYDRFARITPDGGANFNLDMIAEDPWHAGNSSGFYWVSKEFLEPTNVRQNNLFRIADEGIQAESIGKLCLWINGGVNHYDHRHIHTFFVRQQIDDNPRASAVTETRTVNRVEFEREVRRAGGRVIRRIIGTRISGEMMNLDIDYTPQR